VVWLVIFFDVMFSYCQIPMTFRVYGVAYIHRCSGFDADIGRLLRLSI